MNYQNISNLHVRRELFLDRSKITEDTGQIKMEKTHVITSFITAICSAVKKPLDSLTKLDISSVLGSLSFDSEIEGGHCSELIDFPVSTAGGQKPIQILVSAKVLLESKKN